MGFPLATALVTLCLELSVVLSSDVHLPPRPALQEPDQGPRYRVNSLLQRDRESRVRHASDLKLVPRGCRILDLDTAACAAITSGMNTLARYAARLASLVSMSCTAGSKQAAVLLPWLRFKRTPSCQICMC